MPQKKTAAMVVVVVMLVVVVVVVVVVVTAAWTVQWWWLQWWWLWWWFDGRGDRSRGHDVVVVVEMVAWQWRSCYYHHRTLYLPAWWKCLDHHAFIDDSKCADAWRGEMEVCARGDVVSILFRR